MKLRILNEDAKAMKEWMSVVEERDSTSRKRKAASRAAYEQKKRRRMTDQALTEELLMINCV